MGACSAPPAPIGTELSTPKLETNGGGDRFFLTTTDGLELPGRIWPAATEEPKAVAIALHGFNDYSAAFDTMGPLLANKGIQLYAYDQRGFGEAPGRMAWAGATRMLEDLMDAVTVIRQRHPTLDLVLIGESMGGALALDAVAAPYPIDVDRVVLIAPAVWGHSTMGPLERGLLASLNATIPGFHITFQARIAATDNIETMRRLWRDALVIKGAKVSTLNGLVGLMETGLQQARHLKLPALIVYGGRDQIVSRGPTCRMLRGLPADNQAQIAVYPGGHHMLTRDKGGDVVVADIAQFALTASARLPSSQTVPRSAQVGWPEALCGPK